MGHFFEPVTYFTTESTENALIREGYLRALCAHCSEYVSVPPA